MLLCDTFFGSTSCKVSSNQELEGLDAYYPRLRVSHLLSFGPILMFS
jgi:hypothetical protein